MKDIDDIIELNVGGTIYTTTRMTISSCPDSMLACMINGSLPNACDSNKRIFIDRDGPLFRFILNFLRDKSLNLPEDFSEYAQLYSEANFYRLESIMHQLDILIKKKLDREESQSNYSEDDLPKHFYFTIVSKLYQGTIDSIIGSIRIITGLKCLDSNSKRFLSNLIDIQPSLDYFICEFKFMHEEKIICCKPCGQKDSDIALSNMSHAIFKLAKKYGITTGYWEDMFYLALGSLIPNREVLNSIFHHKYNAKLLGTSICDKRSNQEDAYALSTLVERWYITDFKNV